MATVVEPGIITEIDHVYATVEIKGQFTRGMMVCDWRGIFNKDKNVIVIKKIDTTTVRELFDRIVLDDWDTFLIFEQDTDLYYWCWLKNVSQYFYPSCFHFLMFFFYTNERLLLH